MSISNTDNVIDSRDVIARIGELQEERQDLIDAVDEAEAELEEVKDKPDPEGLDRVDIEDAEAALRAAKIALLEWTGNEATTEYEEGDEDLGDFAPSDEAAELKMLEGLRAECEDVTSEWEEGTQLIADYYFEEYAQEFADDIGAINKESTWPNNHIDWKAAAAELMQDYASVDFGGVGYQIR